MSFFRQGYGVGGKSPYTARVSAPDCCGARKLHYDHRLLLRFHQLQPSATGIRRKQRGNMRTEVMGACHTSPVAEMSRGSPVFCQVCGPSVGPPVTSIDQAVTSVCLSLSLSCLLACLGLSLALPLGVHIDIFHKDWAGTALQAAPWAIP